MENTKVKFCHVSQSELANIGRQIDNNGWFRLCDKSIPDDKEMYTFRTLDGRNINLWGYKSFNMPELTHWRYLDKIPDPLY